VLFGISIILFAVNKILPGDPVLAMMPMGVREDVFDALYHSIFLRLGLDKPIWEQYFRWIYNFFIMGDFGFSSIFSRPVVDVIGQPLRNTIILNVAVNFIYLLIALPVGIRMAVKRGAFFDNAWQVFSLTTFAMPSFFLALTLIFIFSVNLGWLPVGGMPNHIFLEGWDLFIGWLRHLTLPVVTLVIISLASAIRYVRNAMIDALSQDYIRTARSKGLSEKVVIYSHALRNALIPVSTIVVLTLFALLGGAAITEQVFAYNGIGRLLLTAVVGRDRMLIISMAMLFSLVNVFAVLVADVVYGLVDPRVKLK
jgi:peptide/nickel transport system permease protein